MLTITKRIIDTIPSSDVKPMPRKRANSWSKSMTDSSLLIVEILYFLIRVAVSFLEAIFKALVPPYEKPLLNEIVLITGTGHGIGRELAFRLAAQGCTLVCWDKNEEGNLETVKLLKNMGYTYNVHPYKCDVSNREEVLEVSERVAREVGQVTILINNAGIMPCRPLLAQKPDHINQVFNVNVLSNFWTLEAFLPGMKKRNNGHVVAISSMCGVIGLPNAVPYSASKFAVRGLMEALHEEMRTSDSNCKIKFTTVYPFTVETGLVKKPRNRFPSLMSLLTPEEVAEQVVKAIRQELKEVSVPGSLLTLDRIARLFPCKVIQQTKDFLDSGVDPED